MLSATGNNSKSLTLLPHFWMTCSKPMDRSSPLPARRRLSSSGSEKLDGPLTVRACLVALRNDADIFQQVETTTEPRLPALRKLFTSGSRAFAPLLTGTSTSSTLKPLMSHGSPTLQALTVNLETRNIGELSAPTDQQSSPATIVITLSPRPREKVAMKLRYPE